MKLMKLNTFIREVYAPGEISAGTLRREIGNGELPGGFVKPNGTYWVDFDLYRDTLAGSNDSDIEVALSECDEITIQALAL